MNLISLSVYLLLLQNGLSDMLTEQHIATLQGSQIWSNLDSNLLQLNLKGRRKSTNFTEIVFNAVTKLQKYMKQGNVTLGIPVMEPFSFKQTLYDISANEQVIKLSGQVDGTIVGLTDFSIKSCVTALAGLWASVTLWFDEINASGNYTASGLIADIVPVEGQGSYQISLKNVTANLQPQCTGNSSSEMLKQFKVSYNVGDSQMNVDGLMGQLSDIMKEFIQDAKEAILNRTMSLLEATLERSAVNFSANTVFKKGMTDGQLIEYLKQF